MNKQGRSQEKIVNIRPVDGPWTSIEGYPVRRGRTSPNVAIKLLVGALIVGTLGGLAWARWPVAQSTQPDAPIEWNVVQAVPTRPLSTDEIAWQRRGEEFDRVSPASSAVSSTPVQTTFGYCYSGGGINCVVDGDTFYISGEKVRIAAIDAPETHPPRCADEARLGNEATEKLHMLLNSGPVTMTSIDRDRDVYGRLLRNVAVNGEDIGEAMISAGVARKYGRGRGPWC